MANDPEERIAARKACPNVKGIPGQGREKRRQIKSNKTVIKAIKTPYAIGNASQTHLKILPKMNKPAALIPRDKAMEIGAGSQDKGMRKI